MVSVPCGVIPAEIIIDSNWGLLYYDGKRITQQLAATPNRSRNIHAEMSMMYSLLRRANIRGDLRKCFSERWGGDKPPKARR